MDEFTRLYIQAMAPLLTKYLLLLVGGLFLMAMAVWNRNRRLAELQRYLDELEQQQQLKKLEQKKD